MDIFRDVFENSIILKLQFPFMLIRPKCHWKLLGILKTCIRVRKPTTVGDLLQVAIEEWKTIPKNRLMNASTICHSINCGPSLSRNQIYYQFFYRSETFANWLYIMSHYKYILWIITNVSYNYYTCLLN